MAEIAVQIEIDEQGQITVGQLDDDAQGAPPAAPAQPGAQPAPGDDDSGAEDQSMHPVPTIDAALAVARQLLMQAKAKMGGQPAAQQGFDLGIGQARRL